MNPNADEIQGDPAPPVAPAEPAAAPVAPAEEAAPAVAAVAVAEPAPMPAAPVTAPVAHTDYRVVNACISIRRLPDPECADEVQWVVGDIMGPGGLDYPDHLNTAALLERGDITAL